MCWHIRAPYHAHLSLQEGVAGPELHGTYSDALGLNSYMDVITMEEAASLVCWYGGCNTKEWIVTNVILFQLCPFAEMGRCPFEE